MNKKKWIKLGLTVLLAFSLTACGTKDSGNADQSNSAVTMTAEAENAQEALSTYKKLMDQENEILSENTDLWEKVYMEADKGSAMLENGKNYGDFLLDTIENVKDQFSDEEYELLKTSAEKISEIENKLTELEQKYPEIVEQSMDSETSIPGDSARAGSSEDSSVQKFPAFEGKDLDGNAVDSSILSEAKLTVLNVWATYCTPCVNEMPDLETLSQNYKDKGVQVVGLVADVFDDEEKKAEAKEILSATGVTYVNLLPDTVLDDSLLYDITGTPTTLFLDSEGKILKIVEGTRDLDALTEMVDELLAAQE